MSKKLQQKLESVKEDLDELRTLMRRDGSEVVADLLDESFGALEEAEESFEDEVASDDSDD